MSNAPTPPKTKTRSILIRDHIKTTVFTLLVWISGYQLVPLLTEGASKRTKLIVFTLIFILTLYLLAFTQAEINDTDIYPPIKIKK
jgi:hypothetical protein